MSAVAGVDKEKNEFLAKKAIYDLALNSFAGTDYVGPENIKLYNGGIQITFSSREQATKFRESPILKDKETERLDDSDDGAGPPFVIRISERYKKNFDGQIEKQKDILLIKAAEVRHLPAAQQLLEKANGANVNYLHPDHGTALHVAAEAGHKEIVNLLLEKGADPTIKHPGSNQTARELALARELELAGELALAQGYKEIAGIIEVSEAAQRAAGDLVKNVMSSAAIASSITNEVAIQPQATTAQPSTTPTVTFARRLKDETHSPITLAELKLYARNVHIENPYFNQFLLQIKNSQINTPAGAQALIDIAQMKPIGRDQTYENIVISGKGPSYKLPTEETKETHTTIIKKLEAARKMILQAEKEAAKTKAQLYSLALTAQGEKHHEVNVNQDRSVINPDGSITVIMSKQNGNIPVPTLTKDQNQVQELDQYITQNKDKLLVEALARGMINPAKSLLTLGADINYTHPEHGTALHLAAKRGDLELVTSMMSAPRISTANAVGVLDIAEGPKDQDIKKLITDRISRAFLRQVVAGDSVAATNILNHMSPHESELAKMINSPITKDGSTYPTLLHYATKNNLDEVAKVLVKHGANFNIKDSDGKTPLDLDFASESLKALCKAYEIRLNSELLEELKSTTRVTRTDKQINRLLSQGANLNAADPTGKGPQTGYTAMHYAAKLGISNITTMLMNSGGDPNTLSATKISPLHLAARYNHGKVIESFGDKANLRQQDSLGRTAADVAKAFDNNGAIEAINTAQQKLDGQLLINIASPSKLQELLSLGASPNKVLHQAVRANQTETVQALLKAGADPFSLDRDQKTALHYAQSEEISKLLLQGLSKEKQAELCAAKDKDGKTALHYAKNYDQAATLLANGANINAKDNTDKTPLRAAAEAGKEETASYLLSKGASIQDIPNLTRNVTILNSLLLKHSSANRKLLEAAKFGTSADIEKALSDGAYIETLGDKKQTALHIAAANGNVEAVQALIKAGAKVLARDDKNRTPINIAADLSAEAGKKAKEQEKKLSEAQEELAHAEKKSQGRLEIDSTKHKQDPARHTNQSVEEELANARLAELSATAIGKELYRPTQNAKLLLAAAEGKEADVTKYLERLENDKRGRDSAEKPLGEAETKSELDILKQALFSAAEKGHVATAKLLLQHSNSATTTERTTMANEALTRAISAGKHEVVAALASDPQIVKNEEWSKLLHTAIDTDKPNLKIVKALIDNSPVTNLDTTINGKTVAHIAAERGHSSILRDLDKKGMNLNAQDADERTPMHLAAKSGKKDVLEFLLTKTHSSLHAVDANGRTPVHLAAASSKDSKEMIEKLHKAGADILKPDKFGETPVQLAAASNNTKAVAALVAKGADDPKTGHSILDKEILRTTSDLSKANKLYNEIFRTTGQPDLLLYAARSNKTDVALKLINGGYPLDRYGPEDGATALALAAKNGNQGIVDAIIAKADPAKLGKIMNPGETAGGQQLPSPLHYAAMGGHQGITDTLLANGADPKARDKEGLLPIDHAIEHGHTTVAQTLFDKYSEYSIDPSKITNPETIPTAEATATRQLPLPVATVVTTSPVTDSVSGHEETSLDPAISRSNIATGSVIHSPIEFDIEKLDERIRKRVENFLDEAKGRKCWEHANDNPSLEHVKFVAAIHKESAELVKDLAEAGKLHDCPEGVHGKAHDTGDRKIYALKLDELLKDRDTARVWMPKFNKDGTNMVDEKNNQIMDLLVIEKDPVTRKAKITGGTITPPPERSSIEQGLMDELKLLHGVGAAHAVTPVAPTRATTPETDHDLPKVPLKPGASIAATPGHRSPAGSKSGPKTSMQDELMSIKAEVAKASNNTDYPTPLEILAALRARRQNSFQQRLKRKPGLS